MCRWTGTRLFPHDITTINYNIFPVREDDENNELNGRKQAESEHSMPSSCGSDLRATAAEFVPQTCSTILSGSSRPNATLPNQSYLQANSVDVSGLDQYDIPWLYYMYPMQFAYDQGFHNGRSKSPRKFRPKKQRSSISSPIDSKQCAQRFQVPMMDSNCETHPQPDNFAAGASSCRTINASPHS